jgi:glycosyltransferase involved in cell wall biosynthesis
LFVGRIENSKNIQVLIDAFSFLDSNITLVVVGAGRLKDQLIKRTNKLNIQDKVLFTGKINDELLKSAYSSCEVFVLPSLVELEGMVVLEAMAYGKPVLVANAKDSASPYLVEVGKNGYLFDPFNAKDLSDKIKNVVNNEEKLIFMGENSLKMIKRYDFSNSLDQLINLLNTAKI